MVSLHIVYIATYPPRQCGIATFTQNLINATDCFGKRTNADVRISVVALDDQPGAYEYPEQVGYLIEQQNPDSYTAAAEWINNSRADVVILQHEFGIFGGNDGIYILRLLNNLKVPLITVFHTLLREPGYAHRYITEEVARMSEKIVVMSQRGVNFLRDIYDVSPSKVEIIQHGVPDYAVTPESRLELKKKLGLEGRTTMLTFGLISRNKGIENVIEALPAVVNKHPDLLYIVLGATHPAIVRHSGEEYREWLTRRVERLGLSDNVMFINDFLAEKELFEYLSATDLYVTPYLNEQQITSGTLSYAVGAGAAVVSTPYWHAQEILDEGRGKFFDFKNTAQLAYVLNGLLDNTEAMNEMRERAFAFGQRNKWSLVQKQYLKLARQTAAQGKTAHKRPVRLSRADMPPLNFTHLLRLTDSTGMLQHARYGIADYKEGYTIDDNARALLAVLMRHAAVPDNSMVLATRTYLSYIHYMQNEDGSFRNFLSYSRQYLDEKGTEDGFGRTIWALGYAVCNAPDEMLRDFSREIFQRAVPEFRKLTSIRAWANCILGLHFYLKHYPTDEARLNDLKYFTNRLMDAYRAHSDSGWEWFEDQLSYDNGLLPAALFCSYEHVQDGQVWQAAQKSRDFITRVSFPESETMLSIIGNNGWYNRGGHRARFSQQPVDAMAMVLLYGKSYELTGREQDLTRMHDCFRWFLGNNILYVRLYDAKSGACYDGLESYGLNLNSGAESTLAYLISHLYMNRVNKFDLLPGEEKARQNVRGGKMSVELSRQIQVPVPEGMVAAAAPLSSLKTVPKSTKVQPDRT